MENDGAAWALSKNESLDLMRDITLHSEDASPDTAILFELVITVLAAKDQQASDNKKLAEFQLTIGWGTLKLNAIASKKGRVKVELYGGSPRATQQIDPSKLADKAAEGGFLGFFGARQDGAGFSMEVDCQVFDASKVSKMTHFEKVAYHYLPQNYLMADSMVDFVMAAQIRRLSQQGAGDDLVLQKTREYLDIVDLHVMMAYAWKHFFSVDAVIGSGAVAFEEKIAALSRSHQTFVMLIFQSCEHVFAASWPPDYPTRSSPAGDFEAKEAQFRSKMLAVVAEHPEYVLSHATNKDKLQAAAKNLLGKGPKVAELEECKDGVLGEAEG